MFSSNFTFLMEIGLSSFIKISNMNECVVLILNKICARIFIMSILPDTASLTPSSSFCCSTFGCSPFFVYIIGHYIQLNLTFLVYTLRISHPQWSWFHSQSPNISTLFMPFRKRLKYIILNLDTFSRF